MPIERDKFGDYETGSVPSGQYTAPPDKKEGPISEETITPEADQREYDLSEKVRSRLNSGLTSSFLGLAQAVLGFIGTVGSLGLGTVFGTTNLMSAGWAAYQKGDKVEDGIRNALAKEGMPKAEIDRVMRLAKGDVDRTQKEVDAIDKEANDYEIPRSQLSGNTSLQGGLSGGTGTSGDNQTPQGMTNSFWDKYVNQVFGESGTNLLDSLNERNTVLAGRSGAITGDYIQDLEGIRGSISPSRYPAIPIGDAKLPYVPKRMHSNANILSGLAGSEHKARMTDALSFYPNKGYFEYIDRLDPMAKFEQNYQQKERLGTVELPSQSTWEQVAPYAQPVADTVTGLLKLWMENKGTEAGTPANSDNFYDYGDYYNQGGQSGPGNQPAYVDPYAYQY